MIHSFLWSGDHFQFHLWKPQLSAKFKMYSCKASSKNELSWPHKMEWTPLADYGNLSSSCTPSLIFGPYTWLPANMLIPRWLMSTNVNTNVNATKLIAQDNIKLDNTITHVFLRPTFPTCISTMLKASKSSMNESFRSKFPKASPTFDETITTWIPMTSMLSRSDPASKDL